MRSSVLFPLLLAVLTACSDMQHVTSADQQYLLFASEIDQFHIENYRHKLTPQELPYIFLKRYTEEYGFVGWYGAILRGHDGREVKYLCLVNVLPTVGEARDLFGRMTPESSPSELGMEETVDPRRYQADEAYLYRASSYFHLIIRSSRIVYTVVVDGARVEEYQVRNGLLKKIAYLEGHQNSMR